MSRCGNGCAGTGLNPFFQFNPGIAGKAHEADAYAALRIGPYNLALRMNNGRGPGQLKAHAQDFVFLHRVAKTQAHASHREIDEIRTPVNGAAKADVDGA